MQSTNLDQQQRHYTDNSQKASESRALIDLKFEEIDQLLQRQFDRSQQMNKDDWEFIAGNLFSAATQFGIMGVINKGVSKAGRKIGNAINFKKPKNIEQFAHPINFDDKMRKQFLNSEQKLKNQFKRSDQQIQNILDSSKFTKADKMKEIKFINSIDAESYDKFIDAYNLKGKDIKHNFQETQLQNVGDNIFTDVEKKLNTIPEELDDMLAFRKNGWKEIIDQDQTFGDFGEGLHRVFGVKNDNQVLADNLFNQRIQSSEKLLQNFEKDFEPQLKLGRNRTLKYDQEVEKLKQEITKIQDFQGVDQEVSKFITGDTQRAKKLNQLFGKAEDYYKFDPQPLQLQLKDKKMQQLREMKKQGLRKKQLTEEELDLMKENDFSFNKVQIRKPQIVKQQIVNQDLNKTLPLEGDLQVKIEQPNIIKQIEQPNIQQQERLQNLKQQKERLQKLQDQKKTGQQQSMLREEYYGDVDYSNLDKVNPKVQQQIKQINEQQQKARKANDRARQELTGNLLEDLDPKEVERLSRLAKFKKAVEKQKLK